MSRRRLVTIVAVAMALVVAACGGSSKRDPVVAIQAGLARVQRAHLDLRFVAEAGAEGHGTGDVGFALAGPFALPTANGGLPVAKLTSTMLRGQQPAVESTFVSTGSRAWVVTEGRPVELRGAQLDSLRGSTATGADLESLHLADWFATRKVAEAGDRVTVTGTLDAAAAINDVLALAAPLGAGSQPPLRGKDATRLQSLVRSSTVRVVAVGKTPTLRELHFDVRFEPGKAAAEDLASLLPSLAGVGLSFDLRLTAVGAEVVVEPPTGT